MFNSIKKSMIIPVFLVLALIIFSFIVFSRPPPDKSRLKVKFASGDKFQDVSVEKDEARVSFRIMIPAGSQIKKQANQLTISQATAATDIIFEKLPNGVKEKIILQKPTTANEFLFPISLENLTFRRRYDNSWVFYKDDPDKPIFIIPEPFMSDQNNETSWQINLDLVYKDKIPYLSLKPNQDWLNNEKRHYPVIIDPTIQEFIPPPIEESIQERTPNSKTYHLDNGQTKKVFSTGDIHVPDENGQLREIDDAIKLSRDPDYAYEAVIGRLKVLFKDKLVASGHLKYQNGDKFYIQAINSFQENLGSINESNALVKNNTLTYPEIFPGIDLKYTVRSEKLLEEFIVKDPQVVSKITRLGQYFSQSTFSFKKQADGSFKDEAITIPPPVMYELNRPEVSNFGLHYEDKSENGQFFLDKVIDEQGRQWLSENNRQYPLVIDTTAVSERTAASLDDADQAHVTTATSVYLGLTYYGFMRFTTVAIPNNAVIVTSYVSYRSGGNFSSALTFNTYAEGVNDCASLPATNGQNYIVSNHWPSRTTNYTSWTPGTWFTDTVYNSPSLNAAINEVTSRTGWASNNDLCLMTYGGSGTERYARTWDYGSTSGPLLTVTYASQSPDYCKIEKSNLNTQITVSWNDATTDETYYQVQRSDNGAAFADLSMSLAAGTTSYADTTVALNHTYRYRVRAQYATSVFASWCTTPTFDLSVGDFRFENLRLENLHID